MSAKIGEELARRLAEADPEAEVPVLVTLKPGADPAALQRGGMKVGRSFQAIPVVAGTVRADRVRQLAELGEVELIDYDGEVRAL